MLVAAGVVTVASFGLVGCATSLPDPTQPPTPAPTSPSAETRVDFDDWFAELTGSVDGFVSGVGSELESESATVTISEDLRGDHLARFECDGAPDVTVTIEQPDRRLVSQKVICGETALIPVSLPSAADSSELTVGADGEPGAYWAVAFSAPPTDG